MEMPSTLHCYETMSSIEKKRVKRYNLMPGEIKWNEASNEKVIKETQPCNESPPDSIKIVYKICGSRNLQADMDANSIGCGFTTTPHETNDNKGRIVTVAKSNGGVVLGWEKEDNKKVSDQKKKKRKVVTKDCDECKLIATLGWCMKCNWSPFDDNSDEETLNERLNEILDKKTLLLGYQKRAVEKWTHKYYHTLLKNPEVPCPNCWKTPFIWFQAWTLGLDNIILHLVDNNMPNTNMGNQRLLVYKWMEENLLMNEKKLSRMHCVYLNAIEIFPPEIDVGIYPEYLVDGPRDL